MRLVICPREQAPALARENSFAGAVLLTGPGETPPGMPAGRPALHRAFNDIAEPKPGLVAPSREDIAAILAFATECGEPGGLLVSCSLGVSRSPAAAFAIACAARPDLAEAVIAARLRAALPVATPNARMVALADDILRRGGRMIRAVQAIGRGEDYAPYRAAFLTLEEVPA